MTRPLIVSVVLAGSVGGCTSKPRATPRKTVVAVTGAQEQELPPECVGGLEFRKARGHALRGRPSLMEPLAPMCQGLWFTLAVRGFRVEREFRGWGCIPPTQEVRTCFNAGTFSTLGQSERDALLEDAAAAAGCTTDALGALTGKRYRADHRLWRAEPP